MSGEKPNPPTGQEQSKPSFIDKARTFARLYTNLTVQSILHPRREIFFDRSTGKVIPQNEQPQTEQSAAEPPDMRDALQKLVPHIPPEQIDADLTEQETKTQRVVGMSTTDRREYYQTMQREREAHKLTSRLKNLFTRKGNTGSK